MKEFFTINSKIGTHFFYGTLLAFILNTFMHPLAAGFFGPLPFFLKEGIMYTKTKKFDALSFLFGIAPSFTLSALPAIQALTGMQWPS